MRILSNRLNLLKLCACLLFIPCLNGYAQAVDIDTLGFSVFFKQGHSEVDLNFRDNSLNLLDFAKTITDLQDDPLANVKSVYIEAAASPEGASDYNERLAAKRADNIRRWLLENTPLYESQIRATSIGVDWDGLRALVSETGWEYRDTVLSLIDNTPVWVVRKGQVVDSRKKRLMDLDGGKPWR